MTEQTTPEEQIVPEPELKKRMIDPKGVLQKNMKLFLYLGAALLVIIASVFSSSGKKVSGAQAAAKNQPAQPAVQDNTDNNIAELKTQLHAEQLKEQQAGMVANDPTMSQATSAQRSVAMSYGPTGQMPPCVPGETCPQASGPQSGSEQRQSSPEQQQAEQLAAKERELAYSSRFASNLVYEQTGESQQSHGEAAHAQPDQSALQQNPYAAITDQQSSSMIEPRNTGEKSQPPTGQSLLRHGPEVNIDSAVGQPYVVYEGLTLDTVLMNRLDGDAVGPVKVLVSNPVYSHDHQHVLIPDGTIVLGEAKKIGAAGFGQQRRLAVVFHRMIMPDGYSVDLDQFHGLDQIGEEGLKDKVNNHYLEIFGTSIALGVIAGAAEITQGGSSFVGSGSQEFTNGTASSVSESATTILDKFMQIPPTITIREGHRVKVYFTQDMLLPAYDNHTIPQTF